MKRKIVTSFITAMLLTANVSAAANDTLVCARDMLSELGYSTSWDAETKTAEFTNGEKTVSLTSGSEYFTVNGKKIYVSPVITDGNFYLPNDTLKESLEDTKETDALSLWTDNAPLKTQLTAYMESITDKNSPDFIPVKNRIAVFDLDGTLFCETDPNYFDYTLLVHRVLEDENYKNKASDFEKETAQKIVTLNETGEAAKGLEVDHGKSIASSFAGMTPKEFNDYIQEFKKLPMPSYDGMKRGDGWYKPMLEVVEYLQANDFTVYIVSGTDRLIVRGIVDNSPLDIPNGQIIGSDETLVSDNQGDEDGLNYVFKDTDKLILGGDFIVKNLKMNKVSVIAQEIGEQPVLSFGNSTGDSSMAEYVTSNNQYKSLAFMLCCDDTVRENGNESKAEKMYALCDEYGWTPVSMKNDWKTIYGDSVKK